MRRLSILPLLLLTACGHPSRDAGSLLPETAGGVWQRKSLHDIPPPKAAILRAFEASYEGGGRLTVDLYEAKVSGTAFEMSQHWRSSPDAVCFDQGRFFAVVKWEQADRGALQSFIRDLEKNLKE